MKNEKFKNEEFIKNEEFKNEEWRFGWYIMNRQEINFMAHSTSLLKRLNSKLFVE